MLSLAPSRRAIQRISRSPLIKTALHTTGISTSLYSIHQTFSTITPPQQIQYPPLEPSLPSTVQPSEIPYRTPQDPSFSYQTPIEFNHTPQVSSAHTSVKSITPLLVTSPPAPTELFHWSPATISLCKQIFTAGFTHQPRTFNPFLWFNWEGASNGKAEIEIFYKHNPSHPTTPQKDVFVGSVVPADNIYANHPAFPSEDSAASTIAICHSGPFSSGPPGLTHGGLIATIFDVIGYRSVEHSGRKSVTANLNINFRNAIPTGSEFITVTTTRLLTDRKAMTHMAMFSPDFNTLYHEATALFIVPRGWENRQELNYEDHAIAHFGPIEGDNREEFAKHMRERSQKQ